MAGTIISIKDLVVRAQFDDDLPSLNELIAVQNGHDTQLLVDHLEPGGIAFCLNVRSDIRMVKGMAVERTHHGIEIPIGPPTIGRILNALGDPLDGQAAIAGDDIKRKD
jgi:F-type H+-transporting ATPase subunit beta